MPQHPKGDAPASRDSSIQTEKCSASIKYNTFPPEHWHAEAWNDSENDYKITPSTRGNV